MKSTFTFNWAGLRVAVGAAVGLAVALPAFGQAASSDDESLEEIVIVAIKQKSTPLMELPVSVSAVSGDQIQESAIKDVFDLQQNVPGLIVGQSQTATTSNFAIRGIGSTSNNFGVESAVGLYVDGVYRSRQSSMVNDLIDVESVDVLRGPQGTLFGKNTAAGAIQIRTVRPSTLETNAFIDVTMGDRNLQRISAAANIPLTDNMAFRGTVFSTQRDGYVDDANFGDDFHNDRDRFGLRAQLALGDPSDDFNMRIVADYSELQEVCCVAVGRVDGLFSRGSLSLPGGPLGAEGGPYIGSDFALYSLGATIFTDYPWPSDLLAAAPAVSANFLAQFAPILGGLGVPVPSPGSIVSGVGFEDYRVAYDAVPHSENEDRGLSLEMNKTFENGMRLSSISAFREFDTYDFIDGDFTDVPVFTRSNEASQQSFSQEFLLSGEWGENGGNYLLGAYYFAQELDSNQISTGGDAFLTNAMFYNPDLAPLVGGAQLVVAGAGGLLPPVSAPFSATTFARNEFKQDHDGYAVFAQVDVPLGERLIMTLGGRYTDESKEVEGVFTQSTTGPAPDFEAIALNLFLASQGQEFDPFVLLPILQPNQSWGSYTLTELAPRPPVSASLDDDQTTGTAKISWYPNDTTLVYASYATGFKAGGTNTDRIDPVFETVFGPEKSESIELGFKGELGMVDIRAAYYMTDFDDFQANSFTGTGFNLQNAGKLEVEGFELEATFNIGDTFAVDAYYARNEGKYKEFDAGTCWDTAVFHNLLVADPGDPNPDDDLEICSRSGTTLPYNPEDRAFVGMTKTFPIGNNDLYFRAEYTYASEQFTDGDSDPYTLQDDISLVNVRLGMTIAAWNADLTLWGRNVTDERWYSGSFDAPVQDVRMNSYPSEPMTWGVTFRKNWD